MKKPRVLVIRGGAIGDFVVTLPGLRLLRESVGHCHLVVLGYPGIIELAQRAGLADELRYLGHRSMAPLFAPGAAVAEEVAAFFQSFDLVVSYLFDPDGIFAANLERLGVKTLLACPHRVEAAGGSAPMQLARPLERLAMILDDPAPWMSAKAKAQAAGESLQLDGTPEVVLLHYGSGSLAKNWPLERWQAALEAVNWNLQKLVLISGEAEAERGLHAEAHQMHWPAETVPFWHQLPLVEVAERFETMREEGGRLWFLGHDSGMAHLAAACGLRCALLFGPSDPAVWAPQNPGVQFLQAAGGDLAVLEVPAVVRWWEEVLRLG